MSAAVVCFKSFLKFLSSFSVGQAGLLTAVESNSALYK